MIFQASGLWIRRVFAAAQGMQGELGLAELEESRFCFFVHEVYGLEHGLSEA